MNKSNLLLSSSMPTKPHCKVLHLISFLKSIASGGWFMSPKPLKCFKSLDTEVEGREKESSLCNTPCLGSWVRDLHSDEKIQVKVVLSPTLCSMYWVPGNQIVKNSSEGPSAEILNNWREKKTCSDISRWHCFYELSTHTPRNAAASPSYSTQGEI